MLHWRKSIDRGKDAPQNRRSKRKVEAALLSGAAAQRDDEAALPLNALQTGSQVHRCDREWTHRRHGLHQPAYAWLVWRVRRFEWPMGLPRQVGLVPKQA